MKLPEISVRRPVTTVMVFAAITLLGCVAFFRLNLDLLPDIEPPAVSVITPYPGASATDVESEVECTGHHGHWGTVGQRPCDIDSGAANVFAGSPG